MIDIQVPNFCTIKDFTAISGMSRASIYQELGRKNLVGVKRGKRVLIDTTAALSWLSSLPRADIRAPKRDKTVEKPVDVKEHIRRMAARALRENTGDLEGAREAFLGYLGREELLVLFQPWLKVATGDYLHAAAKNAASANREDDHIVSAEKAKASLSSSRPTAQPVQVREHQRKQAMLDVRASEARNLLLSFLVNGKPIAQVTALEARLWAKSRRRDARFVELLVTGVPDTSLIGNHRSAKEAENYYAQAQEETENA